MSDPTRPDPSAPRPIADAASLFDSTVVRAYNPPDPEPEPEAPSSTQDDAGSAYGIDLPHAAPAPAGRPTPPRAEPRPASKPRAAPRPDPTSRHFDPLDDDEAPPPLRTATRSDSAIRVERASRHDADPESDSSDRVPSRGKKRSSDRAIGFDDDEEDDGIVVEDDLVAVDPVWTRGAEWGPDLVRVGLVAAATLAAAWFALGASLGLAFAIVALGGAACVLLLYPVAITIERPVRITPEQAVTDFFAAASHHFPHYRRMWLLLSPAAREAGRFRDLGEFRASWARRMAGWKEGRAGRTTPLSFRIVEFRGDKSVGLTTSHVEYTVQVFTRGREAEKPINSYRMSHGVVKGPDRMWYLNQGTLSSGGR